MNDLDARVARLEAQMRNWKRLALGSLAGIACVTLAAAAPQDGKPEQLRAESLVVGDPDKARIEMTTQADGSFLILYDENGQQRWRVAAKQNGPYLQLRDARGRIVHKIP